MPEGPYTREVVFTYRLAGGRIAERWAVRNDLRMMRQLGADPVPVPQPERGVHQ